jgi:hypothetical protein
MMAVLTSHHYVRLKYPYSYCVVVLQVFRAESLKSCVILV